MMLTFSATVELSRNDLARMASRLRRHLVGRAKYALRKGTRMLPEGSCAACDGDGITVSASDLRVRPCPACCPAQFAEWAARRAYEEELEREREQQKTSASGEADPLAVVAQTRHTGAVASRSAAAPLAGGIDSGGAAETDGGKGRGAAPRASERFLDLSPSPEPAAEAKFMGEAPRPDDAGHISPGVLHRSITSLSMAAKQKGTIPGEALSGSSGDSSATGSTHVYVDVQCQTPKPGQDRPSPHLFDDGIERRDPFELASEELVDGAIRLTARELCDGESGRGSGSPSSRRDRASADEHDTLEDIQPFERTTSYPWGRR